MEVQRFIRRMRGRWGKASQHGKDVVITAHWPVGVFVTGKEIAENEYRELSKMVDERVEAGLRKLVSEVIAEDDL